MKVFGQVEFCAKIAGAIVALGVAAAADMLEGTVSDPSNLPVSGASVTLTCRKSASSVKTDSQGRFSVRNDDRQSDCQLTVTRRGFAPYYEAIAAGERHLPIRLAIAPHAEAISVVADGRDQPPLAALGSVSLSDVELYPISNNTSDLIQYAKLMAGVLGTSDTVYVDGFPAGVLPPAQMIARITVNADPFSAEYSDGDQTHIDILTKSPDRQFHVHFGGTSLGAGGENPLAANKSSKSNFGNWDVSGPAPFLPLSFSAQLNLGYTLTPMAVLAIQPPVLFPGGKWTSGSVNLTNHNGSAGLQLYYFPAETVHAHLSYSESRFGSLNSGAGGLTLAEAAWTAHFSTRNLLMTASKSWSSLLFRGGLVYTETAGNSEANSNGLGVAVAGNFTAGGPPMISNAPEQTRWTWKTVVQSDTPTPAWTAGVTVARSSDGIQQVPNPSGSLQFADIGAYMDALSGQDSGAWFVTRGNGSARYTEVMAAPFFQKELLKSRNTLISAGVRADFQSGHGTLLSPRFSAATRWHNFVLRTGGGVFVRDLPSGVLLGIIENDGLHLEQFIAEGVSFSDFTNAQLTIPTPVRSLLAPGLTRPRQFLEKSSIERPLGKFDAAVEYTWTRDEHLLGSRRLAGDGGWLDFLESDRNAERQQVHTQVRYKIKMQQFLAYYDWVRAFNDTDGAFSFPANQNDIRAEWARSAGIAPHSLTFAAMLQLPGKISANITESWRGSAPYNITTGSDPTGDGLYTDRGGLPRNSGNGPGYNSLSLYASRRIVLPTLPTRPRKRLAVRVGLQGANLLGIRNYTGVGSVLGSPTFGMPLYALPGRSVRVWMNLD